MVEIFSERQREWFYKKTVEYNDKIWVHNYLIDKTNDLYKDHNEDMTAINIFIERLVAEDM